MEFVNLSTSLLQIAIAEIHVHVCILYIMYFIYHVFTCTCTCTYLHVGRRKRKAAIREEEKMRRQKTLTVSAARLPYCVQRHCATTRFTCLLCPVLQPAQMEALVTTVEEELNFSKRANRIRMQRIQQQTELARKKVRPHPLDTDHTPMHCLIPSLPPCLLLSLPASLPISLKALLPSLPSAGDDDSDGSRVCLDVERVQEQFMETEQTKDMIVHHQLSAMDRSVYTVHVYLS